MTSAEYSTYFRPRGYLDADQQRYRPLLVQPVLVFEADAAKLGTVRDRAKRRDVPLAIYTREMFTTGNDEDKRAAVRVVPTDQLDLVGIGLRAPHRDADAILRGLARHPWAHLGWARCSRVSCW